MEQKNNHTEDNQPSAGDDSITAQDSQLLREIFDISRDLIFTFNENYQILFANKSWYTTLGYHPSETNTVYLDKITARGYWLNTQANIQKLLRGQEIKKFDTVLMAKNGKKVQLSGSISVKITNETCIYRALLSDNTERLKAEKLQNTYYKIAKLIETGLPLQDLYYGFYKQLNELIKVDSCLIALKNDDGSLSFPFYVNSLFSSNKSIQGKELAEYGMRFERPMFMYEDIIRKIFKQAKYNIPKVWMGVPLIINQQSIGILVVQSYRKREDYDKKDLELLGFVSSQLASAVLRQKNQEKISTQAAKMEAIFESGSHIMWTINDRDEITSLNSNFRQLGLRYYGVYLQKGDKFFHTIKEREKDTSLLELFKQKYMMAFRGKPQQFEIRFMQSNGEENWWDVYLNPIVERTNTKITEVSGVAHDITQKKITDINLAESERKFRNIFESLQDVYFRVNIDGIITMASPSVFELTKESQFEVVGKSIFSYCLNRESIKPLLKHLFQYGMAKNFESELIDKAGNKKSVISNFRLVYEENSRINSIEGIARDITDLKKASEELRIAKELAEKSLEVKKRFLSNMSHEIRTPMNGIIGMIDLLASSTLNSDQKEYVSIVKKSSETLLNILNDILDLSKIEAGKMELRAAPVSIHQTIDKLVALFKQRALEKDIALTAYVAAYVPEYIETDETRLLQILSNLTSNAIKFTEGGTVEITVQVVFKSGKEYKLLFEVADTGEGIEEEKIDLLFKQFTQLDDSGSYSKAHSGTGLGLAISKELSTLMGGEIGVRSVKGKGSTFWFTIRTLETEPILQEILQPNDIESFAEKPYIMVVDDNVVNLKVAQSILEKVGCRVVTIQSGAKAIELVKNHRFDLIFMDIQMPVMNGITATKRISALNLPYRPPIIAMTAFSMLEEKEEFLQAGMDDYVSKPINAGVMIEKVKKWFNKAQYLHQIATTEEKTPYHISTSGDIIDFATINGMLQYLNQEMLVSVYEDFETESRQLVEECKTAYKTEDRQTILNHLHTIKGSATTIGVNKVGQWAAKFEKNLKNNEDFDVKLYLDELEKIFSEFCINYLQIIENYLANIPKNERE
jgi:PAS domain S-box-containing protein